jgi:hypothetical protein
VVFENVKEEHERLRTIGRKGLEYAHQKQPKEEKFPLQTSSRRHLALGRLISTKSQNATSVQSLGQRKRARA